MVRLVTDEIKRVSPSLAAIENLRTEWMNGIQFYLGKDVPVVHKGQIVPGKIMSVNATFDHRFIDGFHASVMSRVLRQWMEHPFEHFDKI